MVICATLTGEDVVGGGFGRADKVAIARSGEGDAWNVEQLDVHWGRLHDERAEGLHHAEIARFLKEQGVDTVVTGHMGGGMVRMLESMNIRIFSGEGSLKEVLEAARSEG